MKGLPMMPSFRRVAVATACLTLPVALSACGQSSTKAGSAESVAASSSSTGSSSSSAAADQSSPSSSPETSESTTPSTSEPTSSQAASSAAGGAPTASTEDQSRTSPTQATRTTAAPTAPAPPVVGARATQQLSLHASGRTVRYTATSSGRQHRFQDVSGATMAYDGPAKMTVSFGDGSADDAGEAGMSCLTSGPVNAFSGNKSGTHAYRKPGTYQVTVRTTFCGDAGATTKTATYSVTVR